MDIKSVLDGIKNKTNYEIKHYENNSTIYYKDHSISFYISDIHSAQKLVEYLNTDLVIFKDYFAVKYNNLYEILLLPIITNTALNNFNENPINIKLKYHLRELKIQLKKVSDESLLKFIMNNVLYRIDNTIEYFSITISEFELGHVDEEEKIRKLIQSVLFDIEYNYSISLETVSYEDLIIRRVRRGRPLQEIPVEGIENIYKNYISELIEYYHIGLKVNHLPFKYICNYHILEYFLDKSYYKDAAEQIKNYLSMPDFFTKSEDYTYQLVTLFKKEFNKNISDKNKLRKVLMQFTEQSEIKTFLTTNNLNEHFEKLSVYKFSKDFELNAIDFSDNNKFYDSLCARIYGLRCSIVHSNPDFEGSSGIPFVSNHHNLNLLKNEILLLEEISRLVIIKSSKFSI